MSITVYNPTNGPQQSHTQMAKRLDGLTNKVIGVIDNGKTNSDTVLQAIATKLADRYKIQNVIPFRKDSFSHPISAAEAMKLARQCDFVIAGVGD